MTHKTDRRCNKKDGEDRTAENHDQDCRYLIRNQRDQSTGSQNPRLRVFHAEDTIPDILSYIQSSVELTRHTIFQILKKSGRLDDFIKNPQQFMDASVKCIQDELHRIIIEGIQYERLNEIAYEMSRFRTQEHEKEFINDRIVPTKKSLYDYITYDSITEKKFAEGLETLKDIKYFIKLPPWFKVPTPVGQYNPDWAILKQNGKIVYMIRETKGTKDALGLRDWRAKRSRAVKNTLKPLGLIIRWRPGLRMQGCKKS